LRGEEWWQGLAPVLRARAVYVRRQVAATGGGRSTKTMVGGVAVQLVLRSSWPQGCRVLTAWLYQDDFKDDAVGLSDFFKDKGNALYKQKQFDEAIAWYTKALDANKTNVAVLTNRAAVHFEMKNYAACIADCKQVGPCKSGEACSCSCLRYVISNEVEVAEGREAGRRVGRQK